jgi:hypothetical protein
MSFDGSLSPRAQMAASGSAMKTIDHLQETLPQTQDQAKTLLEVAQTLCDTASALLGKPNSVRLSKYGAGQFTITNSAPSVPARQPRKATFHGNTYMGRGYGFKRQAYIERHVVTPESTPQPVQDTAVVPI